jgi:hypothetical protein
MPDFTGMTVVDLGRGVANAHDQIKQKFFASFL